MRLLERSTWRRAVRCAVIAVAIGLGGGPSVIAILVPAPNTKSVNVLTAENIEVADQAVKDDGATTIGAYQFHVGASFRLVPTIERWAFFTLSDNQRSDRLTLFGVLWLCGQCVSWHDCNGKSGYKSRSAATVFEAVLYEHRSSCPKFCCEITNCEKRIFQSGERVFSDLRTSLPSSSGLIREPQCQDDKREASASDVGLSFSPRNSVVGGFCRLPLYAKVSLIVVFGLPAFWIVNVGSNLLLLGRYRHSWRNRIVGGGLTILAGAWLCSVLWFGSGLAACRSNQESESNRQTDQTSLMRNV